MSRPATLRWQAWGSPPSEHDEQRTVVAWADAHPVGDPRRLLLAIPNGGHRHIATAGKLRAEGVRAGVCDLELPVPRVKVVDGAQYVITSGGILIEGNGGRATVTCGLWIEMKRRKAPPSAVTPEQAAWHDALRAQGYRVVVARGAQEAIDAINDYLG